MLRGSEVEKIGDQSHAETSLLTEDFYNCEMKKEKTKQGVSFHNEEDGESIYILSSK